MLGHTFVFADLLDVHPRALLEAVPVRWAWLQQFRLLERDCQGRGLDELGREAQEIFDAHLAATNILVDLPTLQAHPLFAEIRYSCCFLNHRPPLGFDPQRIRGRRRPGELMEHGIRTTLDAPLPGAPATLWTVEADLAASILRQPLLRRQLVRHETAGVGGGGFTPEPAALELSWPLATAVGI